MASDIWLRTILIVTKETRYRHIGYSYRLTARDLLYAPAGTRNKSVWKSFRQTLVLHIIYNVIFVACGNTKQQQKRNKTTTTNKQTTTTLTYFNKKLTGILAIFIFDVMEDEIKSIPNIISV